MKGGSAPHFDRCLNDSGFVTVCTIVNLSIVLESSECVDSTRI